MFIEGFGQGGRGGLREVRPAPLAAVAEQGKLADQEDAAGDILHTAIHLADVVGENPQIGNFVGDIGRIRRTIVGPDSQKDQQSLLDLPGDSAIDGDRGLFDTLYDGSHKISFFSMCI